MSGMEQRVCSFCGEPIEPGTGKMFVKKDGTVYYFDRRRCEVSLLKFGRLSRKFKWTRHYPRGGAKAAEAVLAAQAAAAELARAESAGAAAKKKAKEAPKVKPTEAR